MTRNQFVRGQRILVACNPSSVVSRLFEVRVVEVGKHAVKLQHLSGCVEWKSFSDYELERYWELVEVLPPVPEDEDYGKS